MNRFLISETTPNELRIILTCWLANIDDIGYSELPKDIQYLRHIFNTPINIEIDGIDSFRENESLNNDFFWEAISHFSTKSEVATIKHILLEKNMRDLTNDDYYKLEEVYFAKIVSKGTTWIFENKEKLMPYEVEMQPCYSKFRKVAR